MITNKEAYSVFVSNSQGVTNAVRRPLVLNPLVPEEDTDTLHYRYKSLVTTRESFRKRNELEKWKNIIFHSISLPHSRKKRISSESEAVSVSANSS